MSTLPKDFKDFSMISDEQINKLKQELISQVAQSRHEAMVCERELEDYTYKRDLSVMYDPNKRQKLLENFNHADYCAESSAYLLQLVNKDVDKSTN